ncbi:unnamed protein product, partial [Aureobasidium pullulans]
ENVKDKLMRAGIKIEDLDDLIRITIEIDDNLYERAIERRYDIAPRGKSSITYYRYSKKGYIVRDYYSKNKRRLYIKLERVETEEPKPKIKDLKYDYYRRLS